MNARQLFLQDGTPINAWQCGVCNLIYPREKRIADGCCECPVCKKPRDVRAGFCSTECSNKYYAEQDRNRLNDASEILLSDYTGKVLYKGELYDSPQSLSDDLGDDAPEFVHTCTEHGYQLDLDDCITNLVENGCSDHDENDFDGVSELKAAIESFNEKNRDLKYYIEDSEQKVRVPRKTHEACEPVA